MTTGEKFHTLKQRLKRMDRVIIAYSGGVDSTFLLKTASISGLSDILAVTGVSESLPREDFLFARETADAFHIQHRSIVTEELKDARYVKNPPDRCYYCKKDLFRRIKDLARKENFHYILDGTNADDARDWRPGRQAAKEEGVESPLLDAGLSKREIRELSRSLGLPTWDKPATPCLASRFPYGQKISAEALRRVHEAEVFMRKFGVKELRIRNQSETARIEILPAEFPKIMKESARKEIVDHLKSLGFKYVTLDLQGFRSGSSNEVLKDTMSTDSTNRGNRT